MGDPDVDVKLVVAGLRSMRALLDPAGDSKGVLEGVRLGPRTVAKLAHDAGWRDDDLFTAVAICGAESWLYTRAHNDNLDASGFTLSRDVGLWEISIPASQIGTQIEEDLYDPTKNAAAAFVLWKARGWQPWVAYNTSTWLHDTYRLWAYLGVANRLGERANTLALAAGIETAVKVPAVSIPTARKLWPTIPLG